MLQDNICTSGLRTTAGSKVLDSYLPPFDATTVAKLRAAGAVLIGKTNMDEFGMGSTTENSAYKVRHALILYPTATKCLISTLVAIEHTRRRWQGHRLGSYAGLPKAALARAQAWFLCRPVPLVSTWKLLLACCLFIVTTALCTVCRPTGYQQPLGHQPCAWGVLWRLSSSSSSAAVCGSTRQRHRRQHQAASTLLWCGWAQAQLWACLTLWPDCLCLLTGCHWAPHTQCGGCCAAAGGHCRT